MKKLLFVLGILVLINLQYSLIFKNNNVFDYLYLKNQNSTIISKIITLESKNKDLTQEINELSRSSHALENFARYNLGLVKSDETYIHIIDK